MALGLNDLKNKSLARERNQRKTFSAATSEAPKTEARMPIKPWSNRGLARVGISRRQEVGNHHLNAEWIDIQDRSFLGVDVNLGPDLHHEDSTRKLQRRLSN